MKLSLKKIKEFELITTDKTNGKVKDILFDEEQWVIRFIEADFGNFFNSRRVLIPGSFLRNTDWNNAEITLTINDSEIEKCPEIDNHKPVSREYETELFHYYNINPYWTAPGKDMAGRIYPPRPAHVPVKIVNHEKLDSALRSYAEVSGYILRATDGKLGEIEDLIVDTEDWQLLYIIIDTSNSLLWSKKVMVPVFTLLEIDYLKKEVSIDMSIKTIKNAPDYNPGDTLTHEFELSTADFFSQSLVK